MNSAILDVLSVGSTYGCVVHSGHAVTAVVVVWDMNIIKLELYNWAGKDYKMVPSENQDPKIGNLDLYYNKIEENEFRWKSEFMKKLDRNKESIVLYNQSDQDSHPNFMFKNDKIKSLPQTVYDTIMSIEDRTMREDIWNRLILSGGNTTWHGFDHIFEKEMKKLKKDFFLDPALNKVNRFNRTVIGATNLSSISTFKDYCIQNPVFTNDRFNTKEMKDTKKKGFRN